MFFEMLENMDTPIRKQDLVKIGITMISEKNVLHLPLVQEEIKIKRQTTARYAEKNQIPKLPMNEG